METLKKKLENQALYIVELKESLAVKADLISVQRSRIDDLEKRLEKTNRELGSKEYLLSVNTEKLAKLGEPTYGSQCHNDKPASCKIIAFDFTKSSKTAKSRLSYN
jgi:hypothetical protein